MGMQKISFKDSWALFSPHEKRNIVIYIGGIMLYKFGLEAFNGSINSLATRRYDQDALLAGTPTKTFERIGLLLGLNQACQCVGSILIAPLIKRFPTRAVLSIAILVFGLLTAVLLIVDAATGGTIVPKDWSKTHKKTDFSYFGDYNTDGIIPIYCFTGIAYGMVELIRRVIPRDIVGGNVQKLRRMDAMVHIFYEIAGTSGAFCTALALIPALGNNMSFIITPICFTFAAITWWFVSDLGFVAEKPTLLGDQPGYIKSVLLGFALFGDSVWTGGKIIFSSRKFFWLLPGYAIALYAHRFLENGMGAYVAQRYLGNSAWSQIIVGGSNFGELLGALFVFLFTNFIKTPMPWLRLDAIMLLVIWYIPYYYPPSGDVRYAFIIAATFIPVSFGWAAGDVSLAAYIQASLARLESKTRNVSALGAVMAFLYSTYIVIFAICGTLLGRYVDAVFNATGGKDKATGKDIGDIHSALVNVGGVHFTVIAVVVFASTFIPAGSWKLNPDRLNEEDLDHGIDDDRDLVAGEGISDQESQDGKMEKGVEPAVYST